MLAALVGAVAVAQVVVESPGDGPRLDLRRAPAAEGIAPFWARCTWTERRSDGSVEATTCGGEGQLGWSWADGSWTITVTGLTPEPGCDEAAGIVRARWTGRADAAGILGEVLHDPADVRGRAVDLQAELGDALQRLILPLPEGKVRDGARWTARVREEASGLVAGITRRYTATKAGIVWTETVELPAQTVDGRTVEATIEQWSGSLVHEPARLLPVGRWQAERPLRVSQGDRWIETNASCTGELRR